ncbi:MAG: hypothetical protein WEB53_09125 [Akkermansiaceae bacterium]
MKTTSTRAGKSGIVSYVLVLSTAAILTLLTVSAYRRAMASREVQAKIQLRLDYSEKEDAILRSIMSITPNRAIRAMKHGSNASATDRDPLAWESIFKESLVLANASKSVDPELQQLLKITTARSGNIGDSALADISKIFNRSAIFKSGNPIGGLMASGTVGDSITLSLDDAYPPLLKSANSTVTSRDLTYPIIANDKRAVGLAAGTRPNYNILKYPQINFGYGKPGENFVAKRNWWAFSMNLGGHDTLATKLNSQSRDYVLSIYEIPSQLSISASSFMSLGKFASGESWNKDKVNISGAIFAGKAEVEGEIDLSALSSRRGMALSSGSTIGGLSFTNSPFTPGVRENYQMAEGDFFPVSLASESGRSAFVPINRGKEYFDRFDTKNRDPESSVLSSTSWNNYSVGALQCAMQLDIIQQVSSTNNMPTVFRFGFSKAGVRTSYTEPIINGLSADLPPGYVEVAIENGSYDFGTKVVDVAYGDEANKKFFFQTDVTGVVVFNNLRFGDPIAGIIKKGYFRPSAPYKVKQLPSGKICVAIYPQRFKDFLPLIGADTPAVNNSLVVNVDYTTATGSILLKQPSIPCTEQDYGLILEECADLTSFTKGFSLVTNLRLHFGDDFNIVPATPPAGYTPDGKFFPPCSIFAPEKRYGVENDPFSVSLSGQLGSLASDTVAAPVRPLDSKNTSGSLISSERITVNLRPITHTAELPPITMVNWLVLLEERRKEFIGN